MPNIALSFFPLKDSDFSYTTYRKELSTNEEAVPGTRWLPVTCDKVVKGPAERHRYEVSLKPKTGFEKSA